MSSDDTGARPILRVVRGDPDAAELAALVTVLAAAGRPTAAPAEAPTPSRNWGAPRSLVRTPVATVGWWQQGLPR